MILIEFEEPKYTWWLRKLFLWVLILFFFSESIRNIFFSNSKKYDYKTYQSVNRMTKAVILLVSFLCLFVFGYIIFILIIIQKLHFHKYKLG